MKFGKSLKKSVHEPWKEHYLDYEKLKQLLREDDGDGGQEIPWTEEDESRFVDELINVQLDKVNSFQVETLNQLQDRTGQCEAQLEKLLPPSVEGSGSEEHKAVGVGKDETLRSVLSDLDEISKEISLLEKFSRINFTGAIKAAKKHDRRRGSHYRVRPLLQVRLASLPFNSEDYSPLLYRLSTMYTFIRQNLYGSQENAPLPSSFEVRNGEDKYTSHKFFVHPENLLEVKTFIMRHLPVLVYTPSNTKIADGGQKDPSITSLYFDNPKFSLYNSKVEKGTTASSLRLRWFGALSEKPELIMEKKTVGEGGESEEFRFNIKKKYIFPFIKGEYKMEKTIQKVRELKGKGEVEADELQHMVQNVQDFLQENDLQPLLRANYTRTAFQIPGEDKIRVSLDTDLVMIREDSLDTDRPCREPDDWHRTDIDDAGLKYPFSSVKKGEITRFPYAVLEIKVREGIKKKRLEWVDELTSSHLVKEAPRFSKFVHGVASLFEDYINTLPFWMSLIDTDIRRDPGTAFEEEQKKKAKLVEDEVAVGSLLGSLPESSIRHVAGSPLSRPSPRDIAARKQSSHDKAKQPSMAELSRKTSTKIDPESELASDVQPKKDDKGGLRSLISAFSVTKYARSKRNQEQLPPGVKEPGYWIKDVGSVKVEPKVWLANQRTFIKWEHIAVLLATLSLGLYNSAGVTNNAARALAIVYTLIAAFIAGWGWWMYIVRSRMIQQRSGKDFDNIVGPLVVTTAVVAALCINFGLKVRIVLESS